MFDVKKYNKEHAEKRREYARKHYNNNKEKCKQRHQEWVNANRSRVRKINKNSNDSLRGRFIRWKSHAKERGVKFNLVYEDVENIPLICFYTKTILTLETGKENTVSLDRIDNSKPYDKNNILLCCEIINRMKHTMSIYDFIKIAKLIASRKSIILKFI